ncbi:MAG TPA: ATPase F0F1 [Rhodospirillaceae bacterium]|nr:ATPase F0F1 [Rhodospirillaceae bacterium]
MTGEPNHPERLDHSVRLRRLRQEQGRRDGERTIAGNLALIGVLGWTVVLPTLAGIFAGRWLDQHLPGPSRLFWTLGLLVAGLALGCHLGWKRIHRP